MSRGCVICANRIIIWLILEEREVTDGTKRNSDGKEFISGICR
jgi:hypothetical protein